MENDLLKSIFFHCEADLHMWLSYLPQVYLTHWGRVTHICVGKITIIVSDNGLSPGRRQAIIRTNAGLLLIGPLGTNFSEILIAILTFSCKKMRLKVSSAKRRTFCLGLNVLTRCGLVMHICVSGLANGLSSVQCLAITWTNTVLLSIGPLGTSSSVIWINAPNFHWQNACENVIIKYEPFCAGISVLTPQVQIF